MTLLIVQLTGPTRLSMMYVSSVGADDGGPNVVVEKMSVIVEGRPDIDLDLAGLYQSFEHVYV